MSRIAMPLNIRAATLEDVAALQALIAVSARQLCQADYSAAQVEAALLGAWAVDSQLIQDGTYFVGLIGEQFAVCGGWSKRETAFGGDAHSDRRPRLLNPASEAARIRAFFVAPKHTRLGLASELLVHCEAQVAAHGFAKVELVATLPGERLYRSQGYQSIERRLYPLPDQQAIEFVSMRKTLT